MVQNRSLANRKEALKGRSLIIQKIRQFFNEGGYLEVDTPLRIPAPAPESHIDAVPSGNWFLQTSPELCMKRMLAAGYERIFQICRCWRDGERGKRHLPEFTMLEWYRLESDYRDLMDDCEALVRFLSCAIHKNAGISYLGKTIELEAPWEKITVEEAFLRYTAMSVEEAEEKDLFDELMVNDIEPNLGINRPTFIYDYPAARGALARLKKENGKLAERFELYMGGIELANGFSELNDSQEQRERFAKEGEFRASMGKTAYPLPDRFLDELSGMGPAAGIALGVDRLVMLLLDVQEIDGVVSFTPEDL
ncbi:translation elongation factor P-lysine lysyltransferase [Geotalea daltonii FRC-32]|uniref:Translation elongation factor P-lysine lysyltransferase n=1 Tax=Geotalea daltonii (strain DSM 22248 / JCM 15807 / FRC-32) TaxID=316067 RepID=B9M213_GEODF|nr:EF-P lysine aminoacylase EpmA [Geotalea daltonii]ACM21131.1 translation elongation factor P-lysine lysyltransferase [Geotalea daltonii FRC-32]